MTKSITWHTARGTEVTLAILTRIEMVADASLEQSCWRLRITVGGRLMIGEPRRIDHPQAGPAMEIENGSRIEGKKEILQSIVAPIPADLIAEVDALIAEYRAGIAASIERDRAAETRPAVDLSRRLAAAMYRDDSDL